ncbi:MAG: glycosyl transferase 39 [Frankiales bacterium]|nr:glycosyl transferase 39 [Frankiales bacterium]
MTATLDRPVSEVEPMTWRDRMQPLVSGTGGWGVTFLITLIAGLLRFIRLDQPATSIDDKGIVTSNYRMFDEVYYSCDAQNLLHHGVERAVTDQMTCIPKVPGEGAFVVHPPLGKWMIAIGEQLGGVNTLGWRLSAAFFGTLTVLLLVRIGRRMTGSTLLGGLAGLLLALDGLHFVQSRIAMVDVFLCFWVVAAFGALVIDRDQIRERLAARSDEELASLKGLGFRRWQLAAGICFGAALATKWSALFPIAVMLMLALSWEVGARKAAGIRAPWRTTLRRTSVSFLAVLVVVPVAVYVASWTGWFMSTEGYDRLWASGRSTSYGFIPEAMRSWWHYHYEAFHFHDTLVSTHPYQSRPLSWPFLGRPVSYYYPPGLKAGTYGCTAPSCSREVLAIGTPAIWWMMIPASIGLIARWVSRRDWRASSLLLMMAVSILAWVPSDMKHRTMFLFYALPSVPFLCLGLALLAGWLLGRAGTTRRRVASVGVGVYTSLVVLNFIYLYPVLAAVTIPYADWLKRMWFHSWI